MSAMIGYEPCPYWLVVPEGRSLHIGVLFSFYWHYIQNDGFTVVVTSSAITQECDINRTSYFSLYCHSASFGGDIPTFYFLYNFLFRAMHIRHTIHNGNTYYCLVNYGVPIIVLSSLKLNINLFNFDFSEWQVYKSESKDFEPHLEL